MLNLVVEKIILNNMESILYMIIYFPERNFTMTWNEFRNQAKNVAGRAADRINQSASIASLQLKLSSNERKLSAAYEALGKIAYKHFTEEQDTDVQKVTNAVEAVNAIQAEIKSLKAQIEQLKKQGEEKKEEKKEDGDEEKEETEE